MYTGRDQQDTKIQLNPLVSLISFSKSTLLTAKRILTVSKRMSGFLYCSVKTLN